MKIKFSPLVVAFVSAKAHAYNDHASWSQNRGSAYGGSYQYTTETEAWQSRAVLSPASAQNAELKTETPYKGAGFRVSFGTELARFARFTAYSSCRDLTNSLTDSLRAYQAGGEGLLSFYGPMVNLQLGVGLFASRQLQQKQETGKTYMGVGSTLLLGFEKFISSNASISFSAKRQQESLKPDQEESGDTLQVTSTGASFGLSLWM